MTSRTIFGRSLVALGVTAALTAGPLWAQGAETPPPANAGDPAETGEELNEILVTGSRTITEAVRSPTPITSVDISALAVTTPSDTADALNKLPTDHRRPHAAQPGQCAAPTTAATRLSLRNFGPSRTLVLLDGHRVAPNNQDGSVNIDTLPQMLVKRVDIVTGGASAIYGSDAVAGVVNFVLDKDFTGLSLKADDGLSKYGDGEEYQVGAAWGTSLFSDRGHFEVAARMRHQDMIPISERPYGEDGQAWLLTGNGSAGQPVHEHALFACFQQRPERQRQVRRGLRFQQPHVQRGWDAPGPLVPRHRRPAAAACSRAATARTSSTAPSARKSR